MYRRRNRYRNQKGSGLVKITLIFLITFLSLYYYIDQQIQPYIRDYSINEIEYYMLESMNKAVSEDMAINNDDYKNIAILQTNNKDELIALSTDTYKINKIKTNVMARTDANLNLGAISDIYIPIGNLYNNIFFFSKGFYLPVKIIPMTTTKVDFASSFESAGINQSLHKIIMECTVEAKIIMPHEEVDFETKHKIAISETLVLGNVPESYTYIEDSGNESIDKFNSYKN